MTAPHAVRLTVPPCVGGPNAKTPGRNTETRPAGWNSAAVLQPTLNEGNAMQPTDQTAVSDNMRRPHIYHENPRLRYPPAECSHHARFGFVGYCPECQRAELAKQHRYLVTATNMGQQHARTAK